MLNPVDVSRRG